jgi:3-oxoadipate enol-lactonase
VARFARRRVPVRWNRPGGELRDGPLAARFLGDRGPLVVLLPGIAGTHLYWGRSFDRLAHRARVVIPDLPGFGGSPPLPDGHGERLVGALVEPLAALIAGQADGTPALLVGHGVGALLALAVARAHPDRTLAVLGFAPPVHGSPPAAVRALAHLGVAARLLAGDGSSPVPDRWLPGAPPLAALALQLDRPELPAAVARRAVPRQPRRWAAAVSAMVGSPTMRWVAETQVPLRFLAGGHDRSLDLGLLARLEREGSRLELEVWPGLGHDLPLLAPGRCVAEVLELLQRSERRG